VGDESAYSIFLFADADSVREQDLLDFWEREGAMPSEVARERVPEVIFVALDAQGGVAAVSSVALRRAERLGMDLWHYRTFVGRDHRQSLLAQDLTIRTTEYLRDRYASGADTRAPGMFIEVENEILKTVKNEGVWPDTRFVFIGEDASGRHLRVHYFPGALVPPSP
jgi:hypothetical protein